MSLTDAFMTLQQNVNVDPDVVEEARDRRKMFQRAFEGIADRSAPIGSLARGSQIEPIKDVDLVLVFNSTEHGDWGSPGDSAGDALEWTRDQVKERLGSQEKLEELFGDEAADMKWVRHTRLEHHAVKCFLDDPGEAEDQAFTVDVVPALPREGTSFFIPEEPSEDWIATDPVELVRRVLERHDGYGDGQFVQLLRVLRRWGKDNGKVLKGLTLEVLALDHLYDDVRDAALARFFQGALDRIDVPVVDPAGLCGEIQPALDVDAARGLLEGAADLSSRAVTARQRGEEYQAQCLWVELLGDIFPEPPGGCSGSSSAGAGAAGAVATGGRVVQDLEEG